MVRAILAGNKTQTRRVIRFPKGLSPHWYHGPTDDGLHDFMFGAIDQANRMAIDWSEFVKAPYKPGDVLWVRETWKPQDYQFIDGMWNCAIVYKAGGMEGRVYWPDGTDSIYERCGIWRPSIHMPREAARLFLRVTDVRVEKLQSITDEDGKREGACGLCYDAETGEEDYDITLFKVLWDGLNAKRGYGWATNPWVWVIAFERIENHQEKAFGNA